MPWAAAGTPDVSANIPIAPMIQIDAGIIVSLYLVACRPERLLRGWQMAELIIIPQGVWPPLRLTASRPLPEQELGA